MAKTKQPVGEVKLTDEQISYLKVRMQHLAGRNPSWGIAQTDYAKLFYYLAVQKITYLYDMTTNCSKGSSLLTGG